jgi:hypothetical protein
MGEGKVGVRPFPIERWGWLKGDRSNLRKDGRNWYVMTYDMGGKKP